jgi:hypothetical protein
VAIFEDQRFRFFVAVQVEKPLVAYMEVGHAVPLVGEDGQSCGRRAPKDFVRLDGETAFVALNWRNRKNGAGEDEFVVIIRSARHLKAVKPAAAAPDLLSVGFGEDRDLGRSIGECGNSEGRQEGGMGEKSPHVFALRDCTKGRWDVYRRVSARLRLLTDERLTDFLEPEADSFLECQP